MPFVTAQLNATTPLVISDKNIEMLSQQEGISWTPDALKLLSMSGQSIIWGGCNAKCKADACTTVTARHVNDYAKLCLGRNIPGYEQFLDVTDSEITILSAENDINWTFEAMNLLKESKLQQQLWRGCIQRCKVENCLTVSSRNINDTHTEIFGTNIPGFKQYPNYLEFH